MTVETSDRKQTFLGGQSALTFAFRTLVSNPEYIQVKNVVVATGVESDLTYGVDYTVAVNSDGIGGTVTLAPTFSTAYNHVVYRLTSAVQASDYDDYNQFPANTLENDLDRSILIAQEQAEETDRTLRYPISASGASTELPAPEADAFLAWNSAGTALINAPIPDPSTLVKASDAEAAAGVEDTHFMTPAKTATAIAALVPTASQAQAEAASSNAVYMTPLRVKNEVQKSGAVAIPATNVKAVYPVGCIYLSTVATNPNSVFGFGTWAAFGAGRVLVGLSSGDADFDTVEETGGAKTVTLTKGNIPAHVHTYSTPPSPGAGDSGSSYSGTPSSQNTGDGSADGLKASPDAVTIMNPYIVVYMWKRIA